MKKRMEERKDGRQRGRDRGETRIGIRRNNKTRSKSDRIVKQTRQ